MPSAHPGALTAASHEGSWSVVRCDGDDGDFLLTDTRGSHMHRKDAIDERRIHIWADGSLILILHDVSSPVPECSSSNHDSHRPRSGPTSVLTPYSGDLKPFQIGQTPQIHPRSGYSDFSTIELPCTTYDRVHALSGPQFRDIHCSTVPLQSSPGAC